jgi:hypothetical protein
MVTKGSAIYEAELIDKVSGPAAHIVAALDKLEKAFGSIGGPASTFAKDMNVIGMAMKNIQAGGRASGMVGFTQSFNRASETVSQLGTAVGRGLELAGQGLRNVGTMGVAATASLTAGLWASIDAASKATETLNAFESVLGGTGATLNKTSAWVKNFADTIGRSEVKTQEAVMAFQAMFKGLGVGNNLASGLAKKMTAISVDFGSFFNLSDDESMQRFIQALSGSSEVLDKFGINIRENALEQRAFELGLGRNIRKMSELGKTLVRAHIIAGVMKNDFGAVGDAFRTRMDWANQLKALSAAFETLKVSIGTLAIKELKSSLIAINSAFKGLAKVVAGQGLKGMKNFVNGLVAVGATSVGLIAAGAAIAAFGSAVAIAALAMSGFLTAIGATIASGPIGAVVVAVTLLSTALISFAAAAAVINLPFQKMFESLKRGFGDVGSVINTGREVVTRAMAAGDWATAWEGFFLAGELVFLKLADSFIEIMSMATMSVVKTFADLGSPQSTGITIGKMLAGEDASLNPVTNLQKDLAKRAEKTQAALDKLKFKQDVTSKVKSENQEAVNAAQARVDTLSGKRQTLIDEQKIDLGMAPSDQSSPYKKANRKIRTDKRALEIENLGKSLEAAKLDLIDANKGRLDINPVFERIKTAEDKVASLEAQRTKLNTDQERNVGRIELLKRQIQTGEQLTKKGVIIDPTRDTDNRALLKQLTARMSSDTGLADNSRAMDLAVNDVQLAKDELQRIRQFNGPISKYDVPPRGPAIDAVFARIAKAQAMVDANPDSVSAMDEMRLAKAELSRVRGVYGVKSQYDQQYSSPEPDPLAAAIALEAKRPPKFQAASVGTFSASVAGNIDKFGPTFDPMLSEAVKHTGLLQDIKANTSKIAVPVF